MIEPAFGLSPAYSSTLPRSFLSVASLPLPKSLGGAPILLPTEDTAIRRELDHWFSHLGVRPVMVGEFKDYALLRVFGQRGTGLFPVHSVLERQYRKQYVSSAWPLPKMCAAAFMPLPPSAG